MGLTDLKRKFRDAKNHFTGKQDVIDEYNSLVSQVYHFSERMQNDPVLKIFVYESLSIIVQDQPASTTATGTPYDPYNGPRAVTSEKIAQLKTLIHIIRQLRPIATMIAKERNVR